MRLPGALRDRCGPLRGWAETPEVRARSGFRRGACGIQQDDSIAGVRRAGPFASVPTPHLLLTLVTMGSSANPRLPTPTDELRNCCQIPLLS